MYFLQQTFPDLADHLAFDTWLLGEGNEGRLSDDVLWLWEADRPMIVVGRGSKVEDEILLPAARRDAVRIFRRCSGGATVVLGPGCLVYSLVLSVDRHMETATIPGTHRYVLDRLADKLVAKGLPVRRAGISDLVHGTNAIDRKFSGNSMRKKASWVLYHGTLLYDFPLESISRWLRHPPREPDYRGHRAHRDFVINLPLSRDELVEAVRSAWEPLREWQLPGDRPWQALADSLRLESVDVMS